MKVECVLPGNELGGVSGEVLSSPSSLAAVLLFLNSSCRPPEEVAPSDDAADPVAVEAGLWSPLAPRSEPGLTAEGCAPLLCIWELRLRAATAAALATAGGKLLRAPIRDWKGA